jgi:universal stress protein A
MPATDTTDRLVLLVPVDFSEPSRRAMAWAFDYAQRAPCDLHLMHVVERTLRLDDLRNQGIDALRTELEEIARSADEELAAMAPTAEARDTIGPLRRHVVSGRPADEILAEAERIGADMIVMGTHGLTGVARVLIGSTAEKVVRHAPCTVVSVKPKVE